MAMNSEKLDCHDTLSMTDWGTIFLYLYAEVIIYFFIDWIKKWQF
jgi:hypothetical protein